MKICEKVIKRVEPSEADERLFWSEDTKERLHPGIVFEQWFRDDAISFFDMYIRSDKFQTGDQLRIIVEKVEG